MASATAVSAAGGAATVGASIGATAAVNAGLITAAQAANIVPGVGVAIGVAMALIMAHFARVKGAQTENAKLNLAIPGVQNVIKMIFSSLNQGTMSPSQAMQALNALQQQYWQSVAGVEVGPGQAGGPSTCEVHTGAQPTGLTKNYFYAPDVPLGGAWYSVNCDKRHTASTCVGCNGVNNWIAEAIAIINRGGGTGRFNEIFGSKYGYGGNPAWTATYTPPPLPTSVESLAGSLGLSSVKGGITSLFGGSSSSDVANSPTFGYGPAAVGTTGQPGVIQAVTSQFNLATLLPLVIVGVIVAIVVRKVTP